MQICVSVTLAFGIAGTGGIGSLVLAAKAAQPGSARIMAHSISMIPIRLAGLDTVPDRKKDPDDKLAKFFHIIAPLFFCAERRQVFPLPAVLSRHIQVCR